MGSYRILWATLLSLGLLVLSACTSDTGANDENLLASQPDSLSFAKRVPCELNKREINGELSGQNEQCIEITLPCLKNPDGTIKGWYGIACEAETIQIPDDRPAYALLVSGFVQNASLNMFHFYNFARCLQAKDAYVHYAWWNNLLAPYMQKPLHNYESVPSKDYPLHTADDFLDFDIGPYNFILNQRYPSKAIPAEDYQFQQDAVRMLKAIRHYNPEAAIILVGHSFGGSAIARLAGDNPDIEVDLLAPIDPVGNRTCLPLNDIEWEEMTSENSRCGGNRTFERFRVTNSDWWTYPEKRSLPNVEYLYHRWQREASPPQDWWCPRADSTCNVVDRYYFDHPAPLKDSIYKGSPNVQSQVPTTIHSQLDVPSFNAGLGNADGHGEIVGFRGTIGFGSHPLALDARGDWSPYFLIKPATTCNGGPEGAVGCNRVDYLKAWETDPNYLYKQGFEPYNPGLCKVSRDMCNLLDRIVPDAAVNGPPVANAGLDQVVECTSPNGTEVKLDGSGSSDPNPDDELTYTWNWFGGSTMGDIAYTSFPLGTHTVTLTVDDGNLTGTDTVDITVTDTTAPSLSVSLSPNVLWPPNHKMVKITASIDIGDSCDDEPTVNLVSITSNEEEDDQHGHKSGYGHDSDDIQGAEFGTDDREFFLRAEREGRGIGRVYTVTYEVTDASGNTAEATAEVTVPHDHRHGMDHDHHHHHGDGHYRHEHHDR